MFYSFCFLNCKNCKTVKSDVIHMIYKHISFTQSIKSNCKILQFLQFRPVQSLSAHVHCDT